MEKQINFISAGKRLARHGAGVAAAAALMVTSIAAFADSPVTMAPPIGQASAQDQDYDSGPQNTSQDSVFNWSEVPQNEQAPIRRAVFDKGGYQLYDNAGETIVVPFSSNNLYVMKFAVSPTNEMYFVNEGSAPVLYVPRNGYLENATVPGARWYPFTTKFHPEKPVFVGIAPSWDAYIGMGWYSGMSCWGGYWSGRPFIGGGIFIASDGWFIEIGGRPYYGWAHYHDYYYRHPAPYRLAYYHRDVYTWARRPYEGHREFGGGRRTLPVGGHTYGGGHGDRTVNNGHTFGGDRTLGNGRVNGDHRVFQGGRVVENGHASGGGRTVDNGHTFGGGRTSDGGHASSGDHTFGGGRSSGDSGRASGDGRVFNDGHRTFHGADGSTPSSRTESNSSPRSFGGGRDDRGSDAGRADRGSSSPREDHTSDRSSRSSDTGGSRNTLPADAGASRDNGSNGGDRGFGGDRGAGGGGDRGFGGGGDRGGDGGRGGGRGRG